MNTNSLSDLSTQAKALFNDICFQAKTYVITTYNNNEAIITRLEKKPKLYRLPRLWVWYRYFYPHIFVTLFFVFMVIAFTAWNRASGHLVLGSILSLLSSCSVVTSYIMIIPWRKHPSSLILYRALTSVVFSINIILNAVSVNNKNCRSYATVTELMLLAGEAWLTTIAADLVASITNPFTSYKANVQRYQIMVWTCSALITFVFFFDTSCQGRFDNAICWVDIQYQNSACLWGYYLIWMILMYAYQMWASVYAYLRLQKGLPATFEIRKKCAEETFRVLISYAVYMSIVGIFYVIVSTTAPTPSSIDDTAVIEHDEFAFFVLFVIANKGSVDGAVWFMLHEFESSSSSSVNKLKSSSSSSNNSSSVGNTKITSMSTLISMSQSSQAHSTAYNPLLSSTSGGGLIKVRNKHVNFGSNNNNDANKDDDGDDDGSFSPFRDDPPYTAPDDIDHENDGNSDDSNTKLDRVEEGHSSSTIDADTATDGDKNKNNINSSKKASTKTTGNKILSNITENTHKIADHLHVKDVQKEMKNIQKNFTQTITELADLAIEEVDEGDLSPQVNMALRQQIVQYVTSGVKQSVTRVMISGGISGGSGVSSSSNSGNALNNIHGSSSTVGVTATDTRTNKSGSMMANKTHAAAASMSNGVTDAAHVVAESGDKLKAYVDPRKDPAVVEGISIMNFLLDTDQLPFKSFAYDLFHEIRVNEGISDEYYLELLSSPANERLSEGASGAFMFFCGEGEFIVKTIRSREAKVLHNSMQQYSDYLRSNKESLLCKFLGSYSLQVYSQTFYFVIMRNCFDPHADINERYDIKGSWVGRSADPSKTKKRATCRHCNTYFIPAKKEACNVIIGLHEENVVLKDNDMRTKISLNAMEAKRILTILKKDSDLLGQLGVIDYSLLIGVKKWKFPVHVDDEEIEKSKKPRKRTSSTAVTMNALNSGNNSLNNSTSSHHPQQGITSSTHTDSTTTATASAALTHAAILASHKQPKYKAYSITGPAVYYFGIVDFLQDWTFNKKVERTAKIYFLRKDAEGLSVTEPLPYKYRFQKKMEQIFDIDESFDSSASMGSSSGSSGSGSSSSSINNANIQSSNINVSFNKDTPITSTTSPSAVAAPVVSQRTKLKQSRRQSTLVATNETKGENDDDNYNNNDISHSADDATAPLTHNEIRSPSKPTTTTASSDTFIDQHELLLSNNNNNNNSINSGYEEIEL